MKKLKVRQSAWNRAQILTKNAHLKAFVLQDFFDGNVFELFGNINQPSLKDYAKGSVSDDSTIGVSYVLLSTCTTIWSNDFDLLGRII